MLYSPSPFPYHSASDASRLQRTALHPLAYPFSDVLDSSFASDASRLQRTVIHPSAYADAEKGPEKRTRPVLLEPSCKGAQGETSQQVHADQHAGRGEARRPRLEGGRSSPRVREAEQERRAAAPAAARKLRPPLLGWLVEPQACVGRRRVGVGGGEHGGERDRGTEVEGVS